MAIKSKMTKGKKTEDKKKSTLLKPKVQKARVLRAMKDKMPKLVENVKNLLVLKGNKCSQEVSQMLKDLKMLKAPDAKFFSRKNDIHVFEDESKMEFLAQKNDSSFFLLGSNTKKRPNNLVLGRTFDGHILDMMELGVENFKSIAEIKSKSKKAPGSKPCFVFVGEQWDSSDMHVKLQNMLLDLFRGSVVSSVNLRGLDHVIVCTAVDNRVLFRVYSIDYKKSGDKHPRVELEVMGPSMDLSFRRKKYASDDLMKLACKQPKSLKPKKQKNVTRDALTGEKMGRVHVDKQDVYSMQTRRVKALRSTPADLKKKAAETAEE